MIEIIPAILPKDYLEIQVKVSQVKHVTKMIQIDLCDGVYVPSQTWPFNGSDTEALRSILNQEDGLPFWQDVSFELDLMVKNAHKEFKKWLMLGPSRIIFHLEAEDATFLEWLENLDIFYKEQLEIGIAVNTTTDIARLEPYIPYISFVQCMGIEHIGRQGQGFDERVFSQLAILRELYPELILSVDGSVHFDVIEELTNAGANRLVVGSAVFGSIDPSQTVKELHEFVADIV